MQTLELRLAWRSETLNELLQVHKQARPKRMPGLQAKMRAAIEASGWRVGEDPPMAYVRIHVMRWGVRAPDYDGLIGGLKPVFDCLVSERKSNPWGLGVIKDDAPTVVQDLTTSVGLCKKGQERVDIRIEEVPAFTLPVLDEDEGWI